MKTVEQLSIDIDKMANSLKFVATCKLCGNETFCYIGDPRGKDFMSMDIYVRGNPPMNKDDQKKYAHTPHCFICGKKLTSVDKDTEITIENMSVKAIHRLLSIISKCYEAAKAVEMVHRGMLEYMHVVGLDLEDWKRQHAHYVRDVNGYARLVDMFKDRCVQFTCKQVNEKPLIIVPKLLKATSLPKSGN